MIKKILFVGNGSSVFILNLATWLRESIPNVQLDIISLLPINEENAKCYNKVYLATKSTGFLSKLPLNMLTVKHPAVRKALAASPDDYDIVNVQTAYAHLGLAADQLKSKGKRLVVSIWGSEVLRQENPRKQKLIKRLLSRADAVSVTNAGLKDVISDKLGVDLRNQLQQVRFGLAPVTGLKKLSSAHSDAYRANFNLPADAFVVTVGYNASAGHRHLMVIEELAAVKEQLPQNTTLLLPCTYPKDTAYTDEIKAKLEASGFSFLLLTEFMSNDAVAELRMASDVMIQVQPTDQFSGSMTEALIAENLVITGSWLPYDDFDRMGAYLLRVDDPADVGRCLAAQVFTESLALRQQNRQNLIAYFDWEARIKDWIDLYEGVLR